MSSRNRKQVNISLNSNELAILRKLPGDCDAARLRSALMRGAIMDELRGAIQQEIHAALRAQSDLLREYLTDSVDAVRDAEREILSALRSLSPDEAVAKKIAGSLSRVIAHGIVPLADMGRREPLMKEVRALVHASGELDE